MLLPDGTRDEETVSDYAYRKFRAAFGEEAPLPDYFVNAQTLAPDDHLAVQAAAQRHIDSSISKTINVPADIDFEASRMSISRPMRWAARAARPIAPMR